MAARRTATLAAVLLWRSLSLVLAEDVTDCDPDVNISNPFNSCICKHWEKFYRNMYPDVDYDACERLANDKEIGDEFLAWIKKYRKEYPDRMEKKTRYATFAANFVYLKYQNRSTNDYECEVNEFADQSPDEFKNKYANNNMLGAAPGPNMGEFNPSSQQIADEWDWVQQGAVNPPMSQGDAQSCWAFTTAAAIEGGWAARTGNLVELSPQQFVDCTGHGLDAKRGGELTSPITYVAVNNDLCSHESYPYIEMDGVCTQTEDHCEVQIPRGAVVGHQNVQPYSELALMTALYQSGPVGVGIDGMGNEVMFYKSGVLTAPCSANLNHAVTAVGYGMQGSLPYWKIKNSWGTQWGESGYFRLIRGLDGAGGCGIKSIPTVPVFTEDTAIVGPVHQSGALGDSGGGQTNDEGSVDDLINDAKSKWENGTVSLTGAVIISACCLCAGVLCGVCCGGSNKTSRGIRGLLEDDDEEDGEEDE